MQAKDANLAVAVARAGIIDQIQVHPRRLDIHFGLARQQARAGMIDRHQFSQQTLLGVIPGGLPENRRRRQRPLVDQLLAALAGQRAANLDEYTANMRLRPRRDVQNQAVVAVEQLDLRGEITFCSEQFAGLPAQSSLKRDARRSVLRLNPGRGQ